MPWVTRRKLRTPSLHNSIRTHLEHFEVPRDIREFVSKTVEGVRGHQPELDALLENSSENWKMTRMTPLVDRCILRLAVYEIHHSADIPTKVAMDEAIELAKEFGSEQSPSFVNGLLDRIVKDHPELHRQ